MENGEKNCLLNKVESIAYGCMFVYQNSIVQLVCHNLCRGKKIKRRKKNPFRLRWNRVALHPGTAHSSENKQTFTSSEVIEVEV